MSTPSQPFDDPDLQAALQRVCGSEEAPPALRQRIMAALKEAGPVQPIRISLWQHPIARLAIAAGMLVGIAGLVYHALPETHIGIRHDLVMAMLQDHDARSELANRKAEGRNEADVARALGRQLRRPVLAPNLADDGWQFEGGDICRLHGRASAHLVFTRGRQVLSIFSLDATGCVCPDSQGSCEEAHDHVMASLVKTGGLYCAIGHCPAGGLKQAELLSILEQHRDDIVEVASTVAEP